MGGLDTAWQALLAFGGSRIKAKLRTKSEGLVFLQLLLYTNCQFRFWDKWENTQICA